MRVSERGEKGFTLIELLIVIAIIGVLAAVAYPSVQRFIGSGKTEAAALEKSNIQTAVTNMMAEQKLATLPSGNISAHDAVGEATNDMSKFPDDNVNGINLYNYGGSTSVNYVISQNTTHKYYINTNGEVSQVIVP